MNQNKKNQTRRNHLTNVQSQLRMYDCMSPQAVSKLFNEVNHGNQSALVKRIQEKRMQDNTLDKSLQLHAKMSPKTSDIYINYLKDGIQIKHYSIHLCPENVSTKNGPTHMIINQNKNADKDKYKDKQGIPMHVFRDDTTPSKIRIEVGTPIGEKVTPIDQKEANYVAQSLNDLFNEAAQNSSKKPLHKSARRMHKKIQNTLKRHSNIKRRKSRSL